MQFDSSDSGKRPSQPQPERQISVRRGEIDSRELFQSERELLIRHGGETYRLRLTGLNKLILTK
jgi:hemin uptake protein HemP